MKTEPMKTIVTIAVLTCALVGSGFAATGYPVSGKWTYDSPSEPGPAKTCNGPRTMRFEGDMRYDTGGSVPKFQNKSSVQTGAGLYRVVDTFYNGQTWGNVNYTLSLPDPDHIEINYVKGGMFKLRRCA
jgi:hypothetical protein